MERKADVELLQRHLAGVPGAFEELVSRYTDELYGFLCRFVGNATAAEDIIQDAFVQVHVAAESFDQSRAFRPWLYTIAANKARDYLRAKGRRQEYSLEGSATADEDGPSPGQNLEAADRAVAEEVDDRERNAAVREMVDQMPEHLRLILVLGYFQQLPYAQIAEILEIPVGTVKSRLHSAVSHFGKLWKQRVEA